MEGDSHNAAPPPETTRPENPPPAPTEPPGDGAMTEQSTEPHRVALGVASTSDHSVVFAVNSSQWRNLNPPLDVTESTMHTRPLAQWSTHQRQYSPRSVPDARVIYVLHRDEARDGAADGNIQPGSPPSVPSCRVVAIECKMPDFQPQDMSEALRRAMEAHQEFEAELGRATKVGLLGGETAPQGQQCSRPTLLGVLSTLLSEDVTTAEQREQINQVVFHFLQNEISLPKLYSHLTHITGYSTLRSVIRSVGRRQEFLNSVSPLNPQRPTDDRPAAPMRLSDPPVATESLRSYFGSAASSSSGFPPPGYLFKTPEEQASFFNAHTRLPNYLRNVSASYQTPFWVDLPGSDAMPLRTGHHTIDLGGVWMVLGGVIQESSFSFTPYRQSRKLENGWQVLSMINQCDFRCESRNLSGTAPTAVTGAAVAMVGDIKALDMQNEVLLVFGGCNEPVDFPRSRENLAESDFCVYDDLYALDLTNAKWTQVKNNGGPWPPKRAFHNSGVVLKEAADNPEECEMIGFYVAGGIHKSSQKNRIEILSDVWLFSFQDGTWSEIPIQGEINLFGQACVIAGFNQQLFHGGMCFDNATGQCLVTGGLQRFCIRDTEGAWRATVKPLEIGEATQPDLLKRALHSGVCLSVEPTMVRAYELGMYSMTCDGSTRIILLLAGGLTAVEENCESLLLLDLQGSGAKITSARFIRTIAPQLRPFSDRLLNPLPRAWGTVNFFHCFSPVPSTRPRPPVPALLFHGGVSRASTKVLTPRQDTEYSSTWIVSLPSVDPFELNWYQHNEPGKRKRPAPGETQTPPDEAPMDMDAVHALKRRRESGLEPSNSQEICRLFTEHLRHSAPWVCGLNFCPGLFATLGAMVVWPFSVIGNLLENSAALSTRATHISVDFGISAATGGLYLSITDDGRGLAFTTFNRALKRFGNWDGPMERRDTTRGHPTLQYGMGLKFAFSRLGQSALLLSRTRGTIGMALLSQALHFHTDSQVVSCPSCFWRLPSKEPVYPEHEHWKNQQKIQQFSPFDTPSALAEQINTLGAKSGTRLIFFDWKPTFPLSLAMDKKDGSCRLSSAPDRAIYETAGVSIPPSSAYNLKYDDLTSLDETCTEIDKGKGQSKPSTTSWLSSLTSPEGRVRSYPVGNAESSRSFTLYDSRAALVSSKLSDNPLPERVRNSLNPEESNAMAEEVVMDDQFPLWSTARESIDYNLSTYLYWSMLFSPAKIWHAGRCLVPDRLSGGGSSDSAPQADPFSHTLYRYLKSSLHGMVELDYLFHPSDAQAETYGLLGFLNPLDSLIDDGTPIEPNRPYEAGILLYYRERLVKRLFVPFPAPAELLDRFGRRKYPAEHFQGRPCFMFPCTGIIHVPDWLFPNPTREDFVATKSPSMDQFIYKVKKLVAEYLSVCLDEDRRKEFVVSRGAKFIEQAGRTRPLSPLLHMALLKSATDASQQQCKIEESAEAEPTAAT